MKRLAFALFALLAACGTAPQTYRDLEGLSRDYEGGGASPLAAHETPAADPCGAVANHARIGTLIANWEPPAGARVIRPGQPVTDDLRQNRLNVLLDADGRITALECY